MIIATPVSHLFLNKKKAYNISIYSDCLEVRDKTIHLNFKKEKLFHCDEDIIFEWSNDFKKKLKEIIKQKNNLKLISFQATRCCEGNKIIKGFFRLKGKVFSEHEMLNNAKKNISWLKKNIKKNVNIAVENNNFYPFPAYNKIANSSFLYKLVMKNNIHFLFDYAHAKITCANKKINLNNYLEELPMQKLIQIHICKPKMVYGKISLDKHFAPTKKDFTEIRDILKKFQKPKYLTIEYYKDYKVLIKKIKQMKEILYSA